MNQRDSWNKRPPGGRTGGLIFFAGTQVSILRPGKRPHQLIATLYSQPCFQCPHPIPRHRNLRALRILERQNHLPRKPRVHLMNPVHIHQRRAMNAQKACRVETAFEFDDCLIHSVTMPTDHSIGKLVVRNEVCNGIEIEK
jgi:hypothetical protein